jgi:hypothetical protein
MMVVKKVNRLNYVLQTAPRGKTFITKIDKMKKYHGEVLKEWETATEKLRSAKQTVLSKLVSLVINLPIV